MSPITIEPSGLWSVLSLVYTCFCLWMFCACVYREDNRDDRISWAIMLLLLMPASAPFYYWKRYRPLRALRLKEEEKAAERLRSLIAPNP